MITEEQMSSSVGNEFDMMPVISVPVPVPAPESQPQHLTADSLLFSFESQDHA